ncbi:MAG: undecaprenyl-diphosphate phosphatase [Desulfatiglandales bacterium]
MDPLFGIFLGAVQGLTEFLPISSSGHLVLFRNLMGFHEPELLLDTSLHMGTLMAVIVYFRRDLAGMVKEFRAVFAPGGAAEGAGTYGERLSNALLTWVIVGNIPTALIGGIFKAPLENLYRSTTVVGFMLLVTGLLLAVTRLGPGGNRRLGLPAALAVGTAQGLAIIPGISRSGATIACGILLGLDRDLAARFSFLLSVPAIAGALLLEVLSGDAHRIGILVLIAGGVSSVVAGLFALKVLMNMVRRGRLSWFAPYCWALGLVVILVSFLP